MVSSVRAQRIADRIYQELSTILLMEVADPRLENVSITKVKVDRELAFASIYVSSFEGPESSDAILDGLNHAGGFLRSQLAHRIQLRVFPRLRFYWDPSPAHADRIDKLIASLHEDSEPDIPEETEKDPDG